MYKVFIDGAEGTTGLKIHQYFSKRDDIKLINIDISSIQNSYSVEPMIYTIDAVQKRAKLKLTNSYEK